MVSSPKMYAPLSYAIVNKLLKDITNIFTVINVYNHYKNKGKRPVTINKTKKYKGHYIQSNRMQTSTQSQFGSITYTVLLLKKSMHKDK